MDAEHVELNITSELALRLGQLAIDPRSWINRRVERVTYLDASTVRRWISIDFTVPPLTPGGETPMPYVPLGHLEKRKLTNFDLRAEDGRALPMLTSRENGLLSSAILIARGRARLPGPIDSLAEKYIPRLVFSKVEGDRALAWERIFRPGTEVEQEILADNGFSTLADDLAEGFILYLATSSSTVGERRIVKLSFDSARVAPKLTGIRQRLGWEPAWDSFDAPLLATEPAITSSSNRHRRWRCF
ncbi:MAG: hypothetical protein ACJ768_03930 [Gaiellaceae bacterium]